METLLVTHIRELNIENQLLFALVVIYAVFMGMGVDGWRERALDFLEAYSKLDNKFSCCLELSKCFCEANPKFYSTVAESDKNVLLESSSQSKVLAYVCVV